VRVKIYGAGSIGNHLANASRRLGWEVVVCDIDNAALVRMREQIYPSRYGQWDEAIRQCSLSDQPKGNFDIILVGTPPEHHLGLAMSALEESPRAVQIEKPLCPPTLNGIDELFAKAEAVSAKVFVGYDHVVGKAARAIDTMLVDGSLGSMETLDVEFREHWAGIFAAHSWLAGPEDSYLGYTNRGGGASGEHSHALNLWQHFAHVAGAGRVIAVDARLRMRSKGKAHYDDLCLLHLETESGLVGRVVQDVVTKPIRKWAKLQFERGALELHIGGCPEGDVLHRHAENQPSTNQIIAKKRPDDFIEELRHIETALAPGATESPIGLRRAADTMLVLAAAHLSQKEGRRVHIDYSQGYRPEALLSRPS
jgi:predicted dehydrogenase